MQEEAAAGSQPVGDAREQPLIVAHVLEHFHGHDTVELPRNGEVVHVTGDHLDVVESLAPCLHLYKVALWL